MARQSAARRHHESDEWQHLISGNPKILGGKPVIKGTRMPVSLVVGCVGGGMTVDEVMHEYRLTRSQVLAALTYAAEVVDEERLVPLLP
jgi:uncharacterized protein (DUF433 family)